MNTLYIIGSCFNVLYLCEEEEEVGGREGGRACTVSSILSQLAQLVKSLQAQNFIIKVKLINTHFMFACSYIIATVHDYYNYC